MADCGAAGTALDRAIRAATGHQSSSGSKQAVVNLLGHGVVGGANHRHQTTAMPMAPPTSLMMGNVKPPVATVARSTVSSMDHAWAGAGQQQHVQQPRGEYYHAPPEMIHPAAAQHHQMMQQQHMMMQHQMQQINLYMSQQQQQQAAAARATAARQQQTKEQTAPQNPDIENWHDGLEDDALNEAGVQGATIEELAAAWQAAEADYYEDAVNLASAVNQEGDDATLLYPYDFSDLSEAPPSQDQATHDWMKEGMKWFEQGEISRAIRCFETEVRHVRPDNAKAWHMLGKCHAENDEDRKAIACLERSVERDPYNPQALLALGVSYVNELHPARALSSLKAWITHNPRYAGLELEDDMYGDSNKEEKESEFDQVQRLLLRALEYGDDEDGDIQEALGVVYNVSRDYGAAVQAFRKALQLRGDNDYSLWNKLGATLANSNQSEEALPAYHRALQIKPKYARAWLNMAISHSNLQNYDEAARCYLQTLSLNPAAVHCWSYLRIALSCSEEWDLIPAAAAQDLKAFKGHYDFVIYDS